MEGDGFSTRRIDPAEYAGVPDLLALMALDRNRYPFLLQSVARGPATARYDILFAFPVSTLTLRADGVLESDDARALPEASFLGSLDRWWQAASQGRSNLSRPDGIPFAGGWFVYLGYELAGEVEPVLQLPVEAALPVAFATRIPVAVIHDHQEQCLHIVAEAGSENLIRSVMEDLQRTDHMETGAGSSGPFDISEEDPADFMRKVVLAKDRIAAGDVFQVNLSRRWRAQFRHPPDPVSLYRQLRRSNPAPFAGLMMRPEFAVISSSPERLVRRQGKQVETRPIAGTTPRESADADMQATTSRLLGHPKERAEHVMLIDLERNDLGRVCEGGTVTVSEFMVVESYAHVHHIVSNVSGCLRDGVTPGELLRAVFPGGTITGCPKVRCMEVIAELEGKPRGAYTGSMGYLNLDGDCDFNILIRTMSVQGSQADFSAGSGIVADSDPYSELLETRAKAKGLIEAFGNEE